jgi:PAS domain S-box-containing protein
MPDDPPASGPVPPTDKILLRALLEHLPDSVYFKDRASRFIRVNAAMATRCGIGTPAELIGLCDFDLYTAEHARPAFDAEQRILATGEPLLDLEEKETWPDGRVTWVSTSKIPFRDLAGTIIGTFGISRDITIQKLAEEEFRRSEATLRGLLAAVPIGIALVRGRTILTVNPMMVQIGGYSAPELVGMGAHGLYADEAEYQRVGNLLYGEFRDQPLNSVITRWRRKDGTWIDVELAAAPLDPAQSAGDIVVTAIDITERIRAEVQQKELQTQLDLAKKLESIGRLSAGIAHEINTPGQFVADNLRFLAESMRQLEGFFAATHQLRLAAAAVPALQEPLAALAAAEKASELGYLRQELPRCIEQSLDGMARIARIVGALKDFAHPEVAGRTPASLARLIETAAAVSRHEWKYVADLVTTLDPQQPDVPVVVDEINQLLLNLIINAAQAVAAALKQRGEEKGRIAIRTHTTETHAVIEIEDNGTGIPPEVRSHLFEPFVTSHGAAVASGQGLHVVHSIVRRHGGRIEYDTGAGRGTTFRILLPLQPPPAVGTPAATP